MPRPIDPRLSPAQRTLAAQSGLNPRRGRSLQELIDEKWQQSRLNQLGMPIAPIQTGAPVTSPVDAAVDAFWAKNFRRVKPWYPAAHRPDDVVISASPEFLIRPACDALGIRHVMASPVDRHTGAFHGLNCHGAEKVRRFREVWPDAIVENFYSDSHSDDPIAAIDEKAWMVKGERIQTSAFMRISAAS